MAHDAFSPGPSGDYPAFPRLPDGSPDWRRVVGADARFVDGRWLTTQRAPSGEIVVVDLTPRDASGSPINPPTLPPA